MEAASLMAENKQPEMAAINELSEQDSRFEKMETDPQPYKPSPCKTYHSYPAFTVTCGGAFTINKRHSASLRTSFALLFLLITKSYSIRCITAGNYSSVNLWH